MKRVFNKWERLNLKYKLFTITSSLLVVLAVIIYLILYLLLPSYYHKYKISMLDNSLKAIAVSSNKYDTETLKEIIYYMAKDQNLAVVLKNQNGDIIYGNNEVILLKFSKFIINRPKEEHRETIKLKANDSKTKSIEDTDKN